MKVSHVVCAVALVLMVVVLLVGCGGSSSNDNDVVRLSGKVTAFNESNGQKSPEGAIVVATAIDEKDITYQAEVNQQGAYEILVPAGSFYTLRAHMGESSTSGSTTLQAVKNAVLDMDIRPPGLSLGSWLTGYVWTRNANGELWPVWGARIKGFKVATYGEAPANPEDYLTGDSNTGGTYAVDIKDDHGRYKFTVEKEGYVSHPYTTIDILGTTTLNFILTPK